MQNPPREKSPAGFAVAEALHGAKRTRPYYSPEKLLEDICFGRVASGDLERPEWLRLARAVQGTPDDGPSRESLSMRGAING